MFSKTSSKGFPTRKIAALAVVLVFQISLIQPAWSATTPAPTSQPTSTPNNKSFCATFVATQRVIRALPASGNKRAQIATEWEKLAKVAPASIRDAFIKFAAIYRLASTQNPTMATATLKGLPAQGQKINAFFTANCQPAGAGATGSAGATGASGAAAKATPLTIYLTCLKAHGVKVPDSLLQSKTPNNATAGATTTSPIASADLSAIRNDPNFLPAAKACTPTKPAATTTKKP